MNDFLKDEAKDFLHVNYIGMNGGVEAFIKALKSKIEILENINYQMKFVDCVIDEIQEYRKNNPCDCGKGDECPSLKDYKLYLNYIEIQKQKLKSLSNGR